MKKFLYECLHDIKNPKARLVNGFLSAFVIFSIAILPLHFLVRSPDIRETLILLDKIIVSVFTLEYILRIWTDPNPLKFLITNEGLVDFFTLLPFYVIKFEIFTTSNWILLFVILRILKFSLMYRFEEKILEKGERHGEFSPLYGERVYLVKQKHFLLFLFKLFIPLFFCTLGVSLFILFHSNIFLLVISLALFLLAILVFIKVWLDYNYDVLIVTNSRVVFQNRELFGTRTNSVGYNSITNIMPTSIGFIQWLLNVGNVEIDTPSATGVIRFQNVYNPHKIVRLISRNRIKHIEKEDDENKTLLYR